MIKVFYEEYACDHFKKEISKAEYYIANHRECGDVRVVTGSEHFILALLKAVRLGKLNTDEIELYCKGVKIDVDIQGEFIQPWGDDLFEADFYLRFSKE
jgi:hypothetical protein